MIPTIVIRDIETTAEIRQLQRLQAEVWQAEDLDIVPLTNYVAIKEVGGILIGALDGEELIGFAFGFPGFKSGSFLFHSQLVAVKASYRNLNVGYRLKLAQRERALALGVTRMTWAFDPLQSLNAHFNFTKLGVIADSYKTDFYGEGTSSFLQSGGTDRLWVTWLMDSKRVTERLYGDFDSEVRRNETMSIRPLLQITNRWPFQTSIDEAFSHSYVLIEIPQDLGSISKSCPELVAQWRGSIRWAFLEALASGYLVVDFLRCKRASESLGMYLLIRSSAEALAA